MDERGRPIALQRVVRDEARWGDFEQAQAWADDADSDSAPAVSQVVVTGVRPLLGDKIPLSIKDTPQSVNVVPQELFEKFHRVPETFFQAVDAMLGQWMRRARLNGGPAKRPPAIQRNR